MCRHGGASRPPDTARHRPSATNTTRKTSPARRHSAASQRAGGDRSPFLSSAMRASPPLLISAQLVTQGQGGGQGDGPPATKATRLPSLASRAGPVAGHSRRSLTACLLHRITASLRHQGHPSGLEGPRHSRRREGRGTPPPPPPPPRGAPPHGGAAGHTNAKGATYERAQREKARGASCLYPPAASTSASTAISITTASAPRSPRPPARPPDRPPASPPPTHGHRLPTG